MNSNEVLLAYDMKLKRPGCVLLQAMFGGSSDAARRFDTADWLLGPTSDLKLYSIPKERLSEVIEITRNARTSVKGG